MRKIVKKTISVILVVTTSVANLYRPLTMIDFNKKPEFMSSPVNRKERRKGKHNANKKW